MDFSLCHPPLPNSPYGLCGRKGTLKKKKNCVIRVITSRMVLYFQLSFFRPTSAKVIIISTNAVASFFAGACEQVSVMS